MSEDPIWDSVLDAPVLAGNVAHELTNALFALHLHLDPLASPPARRGRGNGRSPKGPKSVEASRRVIATILDRLDELSHGLRLVARPAFVTHDAGDAPETHLSEWWSVARVVLQVSMPKGIDLRAEWPDDLPALHAQPAELTAGMLAVARRLVGRGGIEPPCTVRLMALAEGRWVRLLAVAHTLSEDFAPELDGTTINTPGNGAMISLPSERFHFERIEPRAASMLVARAAVRAGRRNGRASGKNP